LDLLDPSVSFILGKKKLIFLGLDPNRWSFCGLGPVLIYFLALGMVVLFCVLIESLLK